MAENTGTAPPNIIIIKKKKGHGGHHGGAWKVAYADFVTAMMALFIVLWLLSSSADVKKAVGGYFQDPTGKGKQIGSGLAGTGESLQISKPDLSQLKEKLEQAVKEMVEFKKVKDQVMMSVTGEGLRIELLEGKNAQFFEKGSPLPTEVGIDLLSMLAQQLGAMPNRILIEGHTDSKPFNGTNGYSNWELSADRANSARKLMEAHGLRKGQVLQVRGFADQDLRKPDDPEDASNRRISVIVQYKIHTAGEPKPGTEGSKPEAKKPEGGHPTPEAPKSGGHH